MGRLRIAVNPHKCVGSTMCINTARATFVLDSEGKSSVLNPEGDAKEKILEAAESCPVSAIMVADAETGEQLFP